MKFSLLAKFSGYDCWSHELTISDLNRDLPEFCAKHGLSYDISKPGDSEYEYLGRENQHVEFKTNDDDKHFWKTRYGDTCAERFETELEAREHAAKELSEPWLLAQDIAVSGVLGKAAFKEFVDLLGAYAEDVQTMGTLGGPLSPWGGVVPDISFTMEQPLIIECIRATPIPCRKDEPMRGDERTWDRVRAATLAVFGN